MSLSVVSKKYKPIDVLQVYRSVNESDALLGGINPKSGVILLVGDIKNQNFLKIAQTGLTEVDAALVTVDKTTLKFKVINHASNVKGDYYNLPKVAKALGWEEFLGTKN